MAKIISIVNQKGGVAKTTTTNAFGVGLVKLGYKVLLVDLDAQGNLSMSLGVNFPDEHKSIANLMLEVIDKKELTKNSFDEYINNKYGVDFLVGNYKLSILDKTLNGVRGGEFILEKVLSVIQDNYDYVIIDCMPSVGSLTENALCCCDEVIIPTEPHFFSVKGIESLISEILTIKKRYNPKLKINGILATKVEMNTNNAKEFLSLLNSNFAKDLYLYKTIIPKSVAIAEASKGKNLFVYRNTKGAVYYGAFIKEFLRRIK